MHETVNHGKFDLLQLLVERPRFSSLIIFLGMLQLEECVSCATKLFLMQHAVDCLQVAWNGLPVYTPMT